MRKLAAVGFALLCLGGGGCDGDDCGTCADGFFVRFGVVSGESGLWRVTVDVDGLVASCTVDRPRLAERVVACSDPAVTLSIGADETLDTLRIAGTPERVEVVVERDAAELARRIFEPEYDDVRTAAACPVACRQASGAITIE